MEEVKIKNLYNLNETIAAKVFEGVTYPWEVLPKISDFIIQLGNTLDLNDYDKIEDNIWIAKSAKVAPTALLQAQQLLEKCRNKTLCIY